nr:MAG TPA: hypothetical protein [Caudoviricetes sp.]
MSIPKYEATAAIMRPPIITGRVFFLSAMIRIVTHPKPHA